MSDSARGARLTREEAEQVAAGRHGRVHRVLGAHLASGDEASGVRFAVWAPAARSVSVVGEFNEWDAVRGAMTGIGRTGVWELFVSGATPGARYQYEVQAGSGERVRKADPVGFAMDLRPNTASRVWDMSTYAWTDEAWMSARAERDPRRQPMSIYEVHLGSWRRNAGGEWLTYREVAPLLVEHCRTYGFTHVELMPVTEHPYDPSWGYQVTGFFAATARFGTPDDLRALIDELHRAGIGVIVDWVPAHFPRDEHGLARFDGTPLYEHADPRRGEHPDWGTLIFDYGRPQVRDFLVSNALFWYEAYHIDGLRVDAVASMLYLDYSRAADAWLPNEHGGRENLEAIELLREVNERVRVDVPGAFTVAEESTAWPGVTAPVAEGGLGFTFKWDLGWMHDTLDYFRLGPDERPSHQERLTFRSVYAFSEAFLLPLSHDEVVHMKGSLLGKMPGDTTQRFANLRALLGGMFTQPGKKLLFMGSELASLSEWSEDRALPWHEGDEPMRAAFARYVRDLNGLYRDCAVLWADDTDASSFAWIDATDAANSVFVYRRGDAEGDHVVVIQNLSPRLLRDYRVAFPRAGRYLEVLNSDAALYGGTNAGNLGGVTVTDRPLRGHDASADITLPPLACLIFRPE